MRPDSAPGSLDPHALLVDGRVVFFAERQRQRPRPTICRRLRPTQHRLWTGSHLECPKPIGDTNQRTQLTLLSPRLATYTTSSTTSTQVAVEPSFHAGFLLQKHFWSFTAAHFGVRSFFCFCGLLLAGGFLQKVFVCLTKRIQETFLNQLVQMFAVS